MVRPVVELWREGRAGRTASWDPLVPYKMQRHETTAVCKASLQRLHSHNKSLHNRYSGIASSRSAKRAISQFGQVMLVDVPGASWICCQDTKETKTVLCGGNAGYDVAVHNRVALKKGARIMILIGCHSKPQIEKRGSTKDIAKLRGYCFG